MNYHFNKEIMKKRKQNIDELVGVTLNTTIAQRHDKIELKGYFRLIKLDEITRMRCNIFNHDRFDCIEYAGEVTEHIERFTNKYGQFYLKRDNEKLIGANDEIFSWVRSINSKFVGHPSHLNISTSHVPISPNWEDLYAYIFNDNQIEIFVFHRGRYLEDDIVNHFEEKKVQCQLNSLKTNKEVYYDYSKGQFTNLTNTSLLCTRK